MTGIVDQRLAALGVVLLQPLSPIANYVAAGREGNLLFLSGPGPLDEQGRWRRGKPGAGVSLEKATLTRD